VLSNWDRSTEVDSRGAVLFERWLNNIDPSMFEVQWDPGSPLTTPRGFKDPAKAVKMLHDAALQTIQQHKTFDVKWGDVYKFKVGDITYPANGGPGDWGIFRVVEYDKEGYAGSGDTYVAVVEFGKKVHAQVLLSYGNATQPGNKHIGDQLKLLSEKKLRPALLERDAVMMNLERREELPYFNPR